MDHYLQSVASGETIVVDMSVDTSVDMSDDMSDDMSVETIMINTPN